MTTYSSPDHQWHVKAESAEEAAWEFAIRSSDRRGAFRKASRPVQDNRGLWMSNVTMTTGKKLVWIEVRVVV